ncbi:MAG: peptidoglycan DD-metalloendopeptidase family protein [Pseudomonadota bacterium]
MATLDKKIAEQTRLGEYNRRLKEQREAAARAELQRKRLAAIEEERRRKAEQAERELARRSSPPPAVPDLPKNTPKPSPPESEPAIAARPPQVTLPMPGAQLRPGEAGSSIGADRLTPAIPFARAKGKLPLPARGKVVVNFGSRTSVGRRSQGIVIETRTNAQITSPSDAWVVYAGPFRSYGQLLILNAGDNYHILLAGMSRIDVQLGQFVLASEPIGAMGNASTTSSGSNRPVLYVEFRRKQKPIDPSPWWRRRQVVARR